MSRDDAFERDPCREALTVEFAILRFAPAAGDAGSQMVALAHDRAHDGPVKRDGRSFPGEAREELADASNYLVWHRRGLELADAPDVELAAIDRAIAALAIAWRELAVMS